MALKRPFDDQYGNEANYLKVNSDPISDYTAKLGILKIAIWSSAEARTSDKLPVTEVGISIQDTASRIDNDGCIKSLQFNDCADKTRSEIYTLLKEKKIKINKQVIDLAEAEDC